MLVHTGISSGHLLPKWPVLLGDRKGLETIFKLLFVHWGYIHLMSGLCAGLDFYFHAPHVGAYMRSHKNRTLRNIHGCLIQSPKFLQHPFWGARKGGNRCLGTTDVLTCGVAGTYLYFRNGKLLCVTYCKPFLTKPTLLCDINTPRSCGKIRI